MPNQPIPAAATGLPSERANAPIARDIDNDEGVGGVAGDILSWIVIAEHMARKSPKKLDEKLYFKALDEMVFQRSETAMGFAQKASIWKGFESFADFLFYDFVQLIESGRKLEPPRAAAE
jgi:hypothetical protein